MMAPIHQKKGRHSFPSIVVIGSSNTDLVVCSPRLPKPGETILGGDFRKFHGGKGANQAVAAARAGAKVVFVGSHGDDDFGVAAKSALQREGIDVNWFRPKPGLNSGVALILVGGRERQNQIVVARSANDSLSAEDIQAARNAIKKADLVMAQLETPLESVRHAAEIAKAAGVPFLLNPAPARPLPLALMKLTHTITPNELEAECLTGESSPEKAAATLLKRGCQQVVITLGAKGALVATQQECIRLRAPRVKVVDTVGAGDCFNGWLAVGLAQGMPLAKAVERAIRAASVKVTRMGAQAGMPTIGSFSLDSEA